MNITVHDLLWRKVAFGCVNAMSWLVIGFGAAGILYAGWRQALSAVGAIVIIALFSWVGAAANDITARRAPQWAMPVALGGFVLKLIVYGLILAFFPAPRWLNPGWAAAAAICAIVLWQVVEVVIFVRHRQLIYPQ